MRYTVMDACFFFYKLQERTFMLCQSSATDKEDVGRHIFIWNIVNWDVKEQTKK